MADYDITAPDGRKFRITAPDGASQDQVLAYAKDQFAKMPPKEAPGIASRLATAAAQGLPAGPIGVIGSLGAEGLKLGSEALDKAAYAAGGKVTDVLSQGSVGRFPIPKLSPEAAAGAGAVTNAAIQAVPMVIPAGEGAKVAASPVLQGAARTVMQSAMKPSSKSLANGDAAKAIDTMLENGINATAAGAAKVRGLISDLKKQVGEIISLSPAEVNRGYAYKELAKTLDDVGQKASGYKPDQQAVLKAWEEFKNHPLLDKFAEVDDMIPIQAADRMKRASQKAAESAYGAATPPTAADKSQMAIATGLRKGMEEAEPSVGVINKKLSDFINVLQQVEPRAAMAANRDLGGLVPITHSPEAAALMLADRNPWIKSYLARILNSGSEQIPANTARSLAAMIEAAKMQQQQGQP
jgi:hypothetical protein